METRVNRALENRKKGYNCAQAVLCAYSDLLGAEEELLFAVSEGFGGGMGGMQGVCGAVTGMYMAAGLKNSCKDLGVCSTKPVTSRMVRELAKDFKEKNQSLICRELKGVDTGKMLRSCEGCIEDAVRLIGEQFFKEDLAEASEESCI